MSGWQLHTPHGPERHHAYQDLLDARTLGLADWQSLDPGTIPLAQSDTRYGQGPRQRTDLLWSDGVISPGTALDGLCELPAIWLETAALLRVPEATCPNACPDHTTRQARQTLVATLAQAHRSGQLGPLHWQPDEPLHGHTTYLTPLPGGGALRFIHGLKRHAVYFAHQQPSPGELRAALDVTTLTLVGAHDTAQLLLPTGHTSHDARHHLAALQRAGRLARRLVQDSWEAPLHEEPLSAASYAALYVRLHGGKTGTLGPSHEQLTLEQNLDVAYNLTTADVQELLPPGSEWPVLLALRVPPELEHRRIQVGLRRLYP